MLQYKPSEYEEFVSRLAQGAVTPPRKVWVEIENNLNSTAKAKLRVMYAKLSIAAGFALLFSISTFLYFGNSLNIETYSSNDDINALLKAYEPNFNNYSSKHLTGFISSKNEDRANVNSPKRIALLENNEEANKVSNQSSITEKPITTIKSNGVQKFSSSSSKLPVLAKTTNSTKPNKGVNEHHNKWSYSASISPTYTKQASYSNLSNSVNSSGLWLWAGEIAAKRKLSNRFTIQTGLSISPMGQKNQNLLLAYTKEPGKSLRGTSLLTQYGNVSLGSSNVALYSADDLSALPIDKSILYSKANLEQQFYYLNIPVVLSTNLNKVFRNVTLKTGFSAGYLIGNEFTVKTEIGSFSGQTDVNHRYSLTAIGALEYSFRVTNKLCFLFEPTVNYNFISVNDNSQNPFPVTFNVKFGVGF